MIKQLFKHSGVFFLGSLVSKLITTFAWILLARVLTPDKYGQFTLYFMILQFATFISDFGLNQYYLKHVDDIGRKILFNRILHVRSLTLVLTGAILFLLLISLDFFLPAVSLLLILSLIPMSYLSITDGYYLELRKTFKVSLRLASVGLFFLLGYLFIGDNLSLLKSAFLLFISLNLTLVIFFPWQEIKFTRLTLQHSTDILKESSAYAYLTLTSFFYNKGDSFIVSYLKGDFALGIYSLAYRVLESLSLLPSSLIQNLFPISAKKAGINFGQLLKISSLMFVSGLFFSSGIFIFSSQIISVLFRSEYVQSVPILKIFSLVVLLFFINAPLATVIQSSHLVKKFLPYGILNTGFNILLNLLLIPVYGIEAAAWTMVISETTGLLINLYFVQKLYFHEN